VRCVSTSAVSFPLSYFSVTQRGVILKAVFDFGIHDSRIVEVFYNDNLQPVVVPPNCVIDLSTIRSFYRNRFTAIPNFLSLIKKQGKLSFYLQRTFALGDMLMLVPVIRYLRTLGYDPWIRTTDLFTKILDYLGVFVEMVEHPHHLEGHGISLDGVIERDHRDKALSHIHRVYIYLKALGLEKMPKELDWSYDLSRFPEPEVGDEPYVVLQDGGSTHKKRLAEGSDYMRDRLERQGVRVISIGDLFKKQKKSTLHLFSLIAKAKCLITMDSGPLWISHFTKTPIVAIFGPTRPEERLFLHPLYPEGTIAIELSKEVDCEPCFEQAIKCNDKIACLGISKERISELVEPEVMRFWKE